jgi:hypothetical protein
MTSSIAKAVALASVIAVGAMAIPAPAEAGRGGRAVAAGVLGFAAGAIIAGSAARRHNGYYNDDYYRGPPPRRVYAAPRAYYSPEPWTPEWYDYCYSKYRSFDGRTGTYQPYNGPRRFCR